MNETRRQFKQRYVSGVDLLLQWGSVHWWRQKFSCGGLQTGVWGTEVLQWGPRPKPWRGILGGGFSLQTLLIHFHCRNDPYLKISHSSSPDSCFTLGS